MRAARWSSNVRLPAATYEEWNVPEEPNPPALLIRTSAPDWLPSLANAYRSQTSVRLIDDAHLGINPINDTLLEMGRKANLSHREWMAVLVSLGVSALGAFLLVAAVLDPEPYTKITFALGTGALLIAGGGVSAVRVLVGHKPPNISVSPAGGFQISFD